MSNSFSHISIAILININNFAIKHFIPVNSCNMVKSIPMFFYRLKKSIKFI